MPTSLKLMQMLASRLERLSADSPWAHRASGVRGNLLRLIERMEAGEPAPEGTQAVIDMAFKVLSAGARELRARPGGPKRRA